MIRRAGSKTKMEEPWCRRTIRVQIGFSLYQSRIRSFSWQAPIYSCNRASKEIVKAHPALLRLRRGHDDFLMLLPRDAAASANHGEATQGSDGYGEARANEHRDSDLE